MDQTQPERHSDRHGLRRSNFIEWKGGRLIAAALSAEGDHCGVSSYLSRDTTCTLWLGKIVGENDIPLSNQPTDLLAKR
jgi:hypothetical protein